MHNKTIIGIFETQDDAQEAISELKQNDYDPKDISIVMKSREDAEEVAGDTGANVAGGAASGAATGAVIGGLAGLVGTALIPGLGAFLIGGPIAAALGLTGTAAATVSGAATGAVAGGLLGALTGLGLSSEDARSYERRINEGAILLAVPVRAGEEEEVKDVLHEYRVSDMKVIDAPDGGRRLAQDHNGKHADEHEEEHPRRVGFAHRG